MPNKKTLVPFRGTVEQKAQLEAAIEKHKGTEGAAVPVLQEAQAIYGYLPEEVQMMVADGLGISLSEVYGIASFYSQFTLNPRGKTQIAVCLGTACYVKGSGDVLEHVCKKVGCQAGEVSKDGQVSVEATRCIGACGLAPVMTVNDDVYGRLKPDEIDETLDQYINSEK